MGMKKAEILKDRERKKNERENAEWSEEKNE